MAVQAVETIELGTWVKLRGLTPEQVLFEDVFHLVPDSEVDHAQNKVAIGSPLAKALVGTKVGEEVELDTGEGPLKLTVLELGRD